MLVDVGIILEGERTVSDEVLIDKNIIVFNGESVEVRDPSRVIPAYVDVLTEYRLINGMFVVSGGAFIRDGTGPAEVRVVSRLRFTRETGQFIAIWLTNAIAEADKAAEEAKKTAN